MGGDDRRAPGPEGFSWVRLARRLAASQDAEPVAGVVRADRRPIDPKSWSMVVYTYIGHDPEMLSAAASANQSWRPFRSRFDRGQGDRSRHRSPGILGRRSAQLA